MKKIISLFLIFILLMTLFSFSGCEKKHTVTFAYADGTVISKQKIPDGDFVSIPVDPSLDGKEFYGWCSDSDCIQNFDFTVAVTSNIIIYANLREPTDTNSFRFAILNKGTYTVSEYLGNETDVTIPSAYNGISVTAISSNAFEDCPNLKSVSIPDSIIKVSYWPFVHCPNLANISVSINNLAYKSIDGNLYTKDGKMMVMYSIGKDAETFSIPDTVVYFSWYTFYNCINLKSIEIPNGVLSIGLGVFRGCINLTDIVIPNSVTRIDLGAFEDCESLTSIKIPASVTKIYEDVFASCSNLSNITVDENNANYKSIDGNLYDKDGTTLIQYAIGKKAETFTIPYHVTSIADKAFYECRNLKSVIIGDNVLDIGKYTFFNCQGLISVTTPKNITEIGKYVFYNCKNLLNIDVPENITSIGDFAFFNCTKLSYIAIPEKVTNIGKYTFYNCDKLSNISLPDSLTNINEYAFCNCDGFTSIIIPSGVTTIGEAAFFECANLTIYCNAGERPSDWHKRWNSSDCPVVWGYTGE